MQTIMRHTILALLILTIAALSPSLVRAQQTFTAEEVHKLKLLLQYVRVVEGNLNGLAGPHLIIEHANVHIQSGTGGTGDGGNPIGRGNLIIGYNELVPGTTQARTGSHNLVIGAQHTYSSHGGLVAGQQNTISEPYASVSGGRLNTASHHRFPKAAGIVGGEANTIDGDYAFSVGHENTASGTWSSVSGGRDNHAAVRWSSVSGGQTNGAYAEYSSISGGANNKAGAPGSIHGAHSSISGGEHISTGAGHEWKAGSLSMQVDTTYVRILEIQGK